MRIAILILVILISLPAHSSEYQIGEFKTHIDWSDLSMSRDEAIWQVGHFIDMLQTETYHREECYEENNFITKALIGKEPSTADVIAWGVAFGAVQHYTFKFIENSNAPKWVQTMYKWTAISIQYNVITRNYDMGIRIGSPATDQVDHRDNQCR